MRSSRLVVFLLVGVSCANFVSLLADNAVPNPTTVEFSQPRQGFMLLFPLKVDPSKLTNRELRQFPRLPLSGRVKIRSGQHVVVVLMEREKDLDLAFVDQFATTDLHSLLSGTATVDVRELKRLTRFKTLRRISLRVSKGVSESQLAPLEDCESLQVIEVSGEGFKNLSVSIPKHLRNGGSVAMDLGGTAFNDADLEKTISRNPNLKTLTIYETQVTDEGLRHITKAVHLEKLVLSNTKITGSGLNHLQNVKGLRNLSLAGCPLNDATMDGVANLTSLKELDLRNTAITDKTIYKLGALTKLETLIIDHTKVTGSGFRQLDRLDELRRVMFSHTPFQDENVQYLREFDSLEFVYFLDTELTDKSLDEFARINKLNKFYTNSGNMTISGVRAFISRHPEFTYPHEKVGGYLLRKTSPKDVEGKGRIRKTNWIGCYSYRR